ncbi:MULTISPECIES: hypothetical protein [Bifidobacterium]|uniref:hypothetical protein n=1 Tax=Bifidobacterium TaxID=1678 RepID=UPI001CDB8C41|nr:MULTISPECIES: hypothetical protein [Bifidobacterium]
MTDIKERAKALREAAAPGSRIGLTELARSNAWRKSLVEQGIMEIVDRSDTTGYLVSVDAMNELLDSINVLESEVERVAVQQMFIARGAREDWKSGEALAAAAQESLLRRGNKVREFLDGVDGDSSTGDVGDTGDAQSDDARGVGEGKSGEVGA